MGGRRQQISKRLRDLAALIVAAGLAMSACRPDASVDSGSQPVAKPTWYEPGVFVEFAPRSMVGEFLAEAGPGGMQALTIQNALQPSTSLADYEQRLAAHTALLEKLADAQGAGSQVVVQIQGMPRWLSSAPDDTSPPCANQPGWPAFSTKAPAADKWDDWEQMVELTVEYLTATKGFDHLWFQLWEEPDGDCFWTDSEANYLRLFEHTVAGAERADPDVRVGGPGSEGPEGAIEPSTAPLVRALIDHTAANGVALDFAAYHLFATTPHLVQIKARMVDGWLDSAGLARIPVIVSSFNPVNADTRSPYWPAPPADAGEWEYDTEMGAAYIPAFAAALAAQDRPGYPILYQLDDHDRGGEYPQDWGARTPSEQHGIRKAMYQAMVLLGRISDDLLSVEVADPLAGGDGAVGPLGGLAGVDEGTLSVLVWSYVAAPELESHAVVIDRGFPDGLLTWPTPEVAAYFSDQVAVGAVTNVPSEKDALEAAKRVFRRQLDLVTRTRPVCVDVDVDVDASLSEAYVIDAAHNNSYQAYVDGGLAAALETGTLRRPGPGTVRSPRSRHPSTSTAGAVHSRSGPPRNTPAAGPAHPTSTPGDGSTPHRGRSSPTSARSATTRRAPPPRSRPSRHRGLPTSRPQEAFW